jgi:hypothetical protein
MGDGHTSDGATSGGGGSGKSGVDVVLDFVDYNAAHAGFRWGVAGQMELHEVTCERMRKDMARPTDLASCQDGVKHNPYAGTMYTKLQLGPLHLGTQATFKNLATTKSTAIMNQRSIVGGAALVFGDTLSLSYGVAYDKYRYNDRNRGFTITNDAATKHCNHTGQGGEKCTGGEDFEYETQRYHGWSAALNMGPVALKGTHNFVRGEDKNSIYAEGDKHSEINLSIAF